MLCPKVLLPVVIAGLLLPAAASAETVQIVGGDFAFIHPPADPATLFDGPLEIVSESFDGRLITPFGKVPFMDRGPSFPGKGRPFTGRQTTFQGSGIAWGSVYPEPIGEVTAEFTGVFTWQLAGGELQGTFEVINVATENPAVFGALIFFTFEGGTGIYASAEGEAYAEGLDFPFGGLEGGAGVAAEFISGELRFDRHPRQRP